MTNLISNAIEHGTNPRVVVDGSNAAVVEARVSNRGTVSKQLAPEIFEPFRRREGVPGSGLGLGLFIARQIATAHGGSLALESRGDETVFTVRLPRFGAAPHPSSGPHEQHPPAGTTT